MPRRRELLALGVAWPWAARAADEAALVARLRRGGAVMLLRHAATDPGIGDPPGFRLGDCRTQRNLSAPGRDGARRLGAWCRARGLVPAAVRSSAWCRCVDTAQLAFGRAEVWPALNSFFDDASTRARQNASLEAALGSVAAGCFEVWVTHQVNITALTGEGPAMGEFCVVERDAVGPVRVLGRLSV